MRIMTDEELLELDRNVCSEENKDYLEKQLKTASEYLTEEQKKRARKVYLYLYLVN